MSEILKLYKSAGNKEFTKMVTDFAPYFSTINPMFENLKPGYAEVKIPNTKSVHNHLGTVHAIAMCNATELAAGIMTDVSIPRRPQMDTCWNERKIPCKGKNRS